MHPSRQWLPILLLLFLSPHASLLGELSDDEFFEKEIRPLLANRCFECHGAEAQESGLRLDRRQAILAGGDSGQPAVVPGDAAKSLLIQAVRREGDYEMPPDASLTPKEIQRLVHWVERGMPWPETAAAPQSLTMQERVAAAVDSHWALRPIERPPLPEVRDEQWPVNPIDYFVLVRLESARLTPSPEADRYTLIRRLTFDLWGLPPTAEMVDAFLADQRPDAYVRLVDQLLASPRYGERWGRHWLDVARYADTRGYAFGQERRYPYAYTYRDYVVRALNEDKPFDRFVLEQLAADQLPDTDSLDLAALGFLTVGRRFNNRHDDIDDQIDVVGRGLLGLTLACARCHDHKFDPIPMEDYYSLYGVFASCEEPDELPVIGDPESTPGYDEFRKQLDRLTAARDDYVAAQKAELVKAARGHVADYLAQAAVPGLDESARKQFGLTLKSDDVRPAIVTRWRTYLLEHARADHPVWGPLFQIVRWDDNALAEKANQLQEAWLALPAGVKPGQLNPLIQEAFRADPPRSRGDVAVRCGRVLQQAYDAWQLAGGDQAARAKCSPAEQQLLAILLDPETPLDLSAGDVVQSFNRAERNRYREFQKKIDALKVDSPGAPPRAMVVHDLAQPVEPRVFLRGNQARLGDPVPRRAPWLLSYPKRPPFQHGSGRLELAQMIVDPANPLTRRVIVNRIWMHHFSRPLVETPSDFGLLCPPPVQPALLDYLAWKLLDGDWSLKALHREILLSRTYRQSSAARPEAMAVDPENRLWWRMNRRRLEWETLRDTLLSVAGHLDTTMGGRPVDIVSPPFSRRRTVYAFIDRQDLPGLFRTFDMANPDLSQPQRPKTIVPQQALFLMNSPFVLEQAGALAKRLSGIDSKNADERIRQLYRFVLARDPTDNEIEFGRQFVTSSGDVPGESLWQQYAQALMMSNALFYVD